MTGRKLVILCLVAACSIAATAQDTVRYTGKTLVNVDYHHGQLRPAVGVHNIQVFRANRQQPDKTSYPNSLNKYAPNWTYNHAPMIAYWNGNFYLQFLSDPVGEHVPPGQTFMFSSKDGYSWRFLDAVFPPYKIPPGTVKEGKKDTAGRNDFAVMHQRIGFYTAKNGVLLTLGYYGIVLGQKDDPNDGNGIGRVVRRINPDGSFGPIYFLRYNHAFNEKNTDYPFYKSSPDKSFVTACDELLASPLQMQQMVEEADRNDPLIPLKKDFKAFSYYRLPNGKVVGLWKYALTSISADGGKTWQYNPLRAPGFVNANAKIWGQRTSDGRYATVYNPSEFRWPLAVSVSDDGLNYKNLLLVNGEITSLRYGGAYKSYGPQYVRGIQEMDGNPPGGDMWVTYSMNKEDMWVSKIPVPVKETVNEHADDVFGSMKQGEELKLWNIYSPFWCKVQVQQEKENKSISLRDSDPFDYAKAERVFPVSKKVMVEFAVTPQQQDHGLLEIELVDDKNIPCLRLSFDSTGSFHTKAGYRNRGLTAYKAGEKLDIKIELNTTNRFYTVFINGKNAGANICFAPVESVERIVFRTGSTRRFPDADTPTDQMYDLPGAGEQIKQAEYLIHYLKTSAGK
ncbi:MAG: exo-alpha-sialidase [Chitinophagaceae bacterium]